MGRLLRRTPPTCGACGGDLQRGAPWCGTCGEHVDAAGPDDGDALPLAPDTPAVPDASAPVHRRGAVLAVVVVLAGLVGAVALRGEPARPVLGQVGTVTGVSATGPPADGLRVAWEHELAGQALDEGVLWSAPSRTVVASGGLVRVGTRVVDAGTGKLVRLAPRVGEGATAVHAQLVDGQLVVVDTLTGRVRARAPAPPGLPDHVGDWPDARSGDVSLFGGEATSVLVRDDGTGLAAVDGRMLPYLDRAFEDPAAFPVRRFGGTGRDEDLTAPLRLVDAATGAVLLVDAGPGARVADVVGDLAMVASTEQDVASPGQEVPWTVRLVAATSGDERDRLRVVSAEAPRLLGTFDDGTAVVATRTGREVTLRAVPANGPVRDLGTVSAGPGGHDGPYVHSSPVLAAVGMTEGSLVVAGDGEVRAIDAVGVPVWRHDTVGEPSLAVGDGLLALLPEDTTRSTRVFDAAAGTQVASLRASPGDDVLPGGVPTGTLVGVLDGHVGVADAPTWAGAPAQLGTSRWLRLTTGAPTPFDDVVAPFAGDERVTGMWTFHGTTLDPATGRMVPVISVGHDREVLHLLEPGEGLVSHELPLPDRDQVAGRFAAPVGATADLFAVWSEAMTDEAEIATHVVDRRSGEVRTIPDVVGVALTAERLLAVEPGRARPRSPLVAVDPVTGERRWSSGAEHRLFGSTTRFDEQLFVTGDVLGVRAVSMRDGSPVWTHEADTELVGPFVLGSSRVLVVTTDGVVVAIDRTAGAELWRARVGTPIASMAGAGDDVLVGTHDGVVVHLDADGHEVQRVAVGTGSVRAVAALGDTVVAVVDGVVVGLRTDGTGITTRNEVDVP